MEKAQRAFQEEQYSKDVTRHEQETEVPSDLQSICSSVFLPASLCSWHAAHHTTKACCPHVCLLTTVLHNQLCHGIAGQACTVPTVLYVKWCSSRFLCQA